MVLAIDIGNTNISFGVFKKDKIIKRFDIPTKNYKFKKLKDKLGEFNLPVDSVICSVVPDKTAILKKDLKQLLGKNPLILGKDIKVPIRNLYQNPRKVGQDRLVNGYAGSILYGAPCIIIDAGTALTFDIVSKNKAYLGGMILPGLNMSLEALAENTALLPKIRLKEPKEFIGKDTENSILSGLVYGFAIMIDGIVNKLKHNLGYDMQVIGTGGDISLIYKYSKTIDKIDKHLTLKGIYLLSLKNILTI